MCRDLAISVFAVHIKTYLDNLNIISFNLGRNPLDAYNLHLTDHDSI